jgi:hypothetical protein
VDVYVRGEIARLVDDLRSGLRVERVPAVLPGGRVIAQAQQEACVRDGALRVERGEHLRLAVHEAVQHAHALRGGAVQAVVVLRRGKPLAPACLLLELRQVEEAARGILAKHFERPLLVLTFGPRP